MNAWETGAGTAHVRPYPPPPPPPRLTVFFWVLAVVSVVMFGGACFLAGTIVG